MCGPTTNWQMKPCRTSPLRMKPLFLNGWLPRAGEARDLFQSDATDAVKIISENGIECAEDECQDSVDISGNNSSLNTSILSRPR